LVLDDLIELRAGDQVLADAEIINADALELDESLRKGGHKHSPTEGGWTEKLKNFFS
ncbi:MAG: hypothetical protein RJA29_2582, partial [Pseudomonadota bacterium]